MSLDVLDFDAIRRALGSDESVVRIDEWERPGWVQPPLERPLVIVLRADGDPS